MSNAPRMVSGKWMILGVVGVGVVMAVVAWLYYYVQQRRPLALWGPAAARLMMQAPQVEAWRLVDADAAAEADDAIETITVGERRWRIAARKDVSAARGLSHLRYGFLNDRCFAWDEPAPEQASPWQFALHFVDGDSAATLLFAPQAKRVRLLETGAEASNAPVAEGYHRFFLEQFPETKE